MKKTFLINRVSVSGAIVIGMLGLSQILGSCIKAPCDGTDCKKELGFGENPSKRNKDFRDKNPLAACKFNVFVESSLSMDAYVTGGLKYKKNTRFKTALHRLIGQIKADVLADGSDKNISLNYINSIVIPRRVASKAFADSLSPAAFSTAGGNRARTNITDMIERVAASTGKGTVSMFVSDCVYSPEPAADIDISLKKQQTDMLNILKNKAKADAAFGVMVYRLESDFHGKYYTKTDSSVDCNGDRPYFVWFFGDESILANVRESISGIMTDEKACYLAGIAGYDYVPYKTNASAHPYHYLNAKANADSTFTFSFYADLRHLPLPHEYIADTGNYTFGKKVFIKKIETVDPSSSKNAGYNYRYTVSVRGERNKELPPTMVEIKLNSMLKELPGWVAAYDDPKGEDYDRGYNPGKLRTFGLKSLVDGVVDFYKKDSPYASFRIKIN